MADDRLPEGWTVEGLWHDDEHKLEPNSDPSDFDIAAADAIVVRYEDELGVDYRTIHGALDFEMISDLIDAVIENDSPVR
jgi:hypothetical protein